MKEKYSLVILDLDPVVADFVIGAVTRAAIQLMSQWEHGEHGEDEALEAAHSMLGSVLRLKKAMDSEDAGS